MPTSPFGKAIPVLASLDISRTLAFYQSILGFHTRQFENASYGIAVRGDTEIHFRACTDKSIAENTSCYLRVPDIRAVHREPSATIPTPGAVIETPWGMDELHVFDADGNLLKFGQERQPRT